MNVGSGAGWVSRFGNEREGSVVMFYGKVKKKRKKERENDVVLF